MSLLPSYIMRQAYTRIGALSGTAAQIDTAYSAALTGLNTESFPPQAMEDMLALIESEIANAVASNENHVWRPILHGVTSSIATGGLIPTFSSTANTAKIIGVYGQVRDAVTPFRPLTPGLHEDEIRMLNENPNAMFKLDHYSYVIRAPRIYATRPNVTIDVCTFDFDARKTAIDADQALLFEQAEGAYFSGLMSNLANEDSLLQALSAKYQPRYQEWIAAFQDGRMNTEEAAA